MTLQVSGPCLQQAPGFAFISCALIAPGNVLQESPSLEALSCRFYCCTVALLQLSLCCVSPNETTGEHKSQEKKIKNKKYKPGLGNFLKEGDMQKNQITEKKNLRSHIIGNDGLW